jgi:transposase-like protein
MSDFRWTETNRQAAKLFAEGNLTVGQIAENLGVTRQTLFNWRQNEEFKKWLDELSDEFKAEVRRVGIATVEKRVHAQNDRWVRMRRVIEARADDPSMADVPGGNTGLMVRTVKRVVVETDIQGHPRSTEVEEFAVDTGLLKELREIERQAAQELGQWLEKKEITGKDGGPVIVVNLGETALMDHL